LSTNGLRLYLDGRLLGTNAYTPRFFTDGPVQRFVFGHSLPGLDDFHGEMDDVRLWRTARTQDQIRANMTARLTGQEPGLIGLWNFDDPAHPGKDATPNGLDGQLIGSAKTVTEIIPTVLITGRITDASGRGLTNAYVELRRANVSINHAQTGPDGYYAFTMQPDERGDLFATDGERSAFRLGFQPSGSRQQRLDWVLTETGVAAAPASNPQSSQSLLTSAATGEPGTVVASVLTKDDGSFDFANLKPGIYQLRCQTPGGRTWFENGRPFRMEPDLPAADAQKLKAQEWSIEPFKKGRWRKFGVLEELKSNNTGRTLFAADGTLWNSANGGLVRFDGREFFMLSSDNGLGVSTSHPLACYLDHTGMLWVGTADGLRRYRPADGVPQTRFSPPGLPTDNIFEIAGTADGAVWWRTGRNLVRYHDGQGTVFTNLWSANPGVLERLAVTVNRLWVTGPGAGLVCFEGTNQVRWTQQQGLPADDTGTVATAPDGTVWFAIGDDGARGAMRFDGTRFVRLMPRDGLHTGGITCIHVASDGLVWFGLAEGTVARFDGRSFIYFDNSSDATGRKSSAVNSKIYDIQQGSDGATWFGTSDRLWRFEENTFRQYSTEDGLPAGGLHFGVGVLMTTPDGSLMALVGTNGMTARFDGQRFWSNALPVAVNHMVSGPDGIIHGALPATPRAPARIALLQGGNILSVLTNSAGQPGGEFQCLTRAADGAIWAGTATNGVVRFAGTNGGPAMTWTNGLLTNSIIAIHGDAHGAVWVAAQGGGIVRFDGTNWTEFTQTNGAPGRVVVGVESGPDGSIWFGAYDGGLARFDGQTMKPVTAGGGTFIPSAVIKIFRAADGTLWFGTLTGVTHYDGATWAPLDEGDGLQPGAVWAIAQDSNGAIWFGGENGLTRYEPRVSTNSMPALIVQTDRAYTNLNELPHITDGRLVTFKLNAVDFRTRPEKRLYRYAVVADRTESPPAKTDTRWNTPTRATQFEWPAPKRGDYTVFVQEIDRDMNYSTPAVAHLTVVPPWYFNGWIMVPSGGLFLGLFGWAFVARVLYFRKRREAEQLREEMANRDHEARARLEKEVREREQVQDYFQSLVESVPVMVYRRDIEGRITFMNRNGSAFFAKAFDTPENPTAGKDIGYGMLEGIVTPKVIARLKEAHHEVIRTGRLMESESKIERLVGPDIWLHSIRTPVVASDGRISGVQYVTWDVTQEQRYLI
jgi:ligand-binding sensor domain-containing protein/PAS domain-containing protein